MSDYACFLDDDCRQLATISMLHYLNHWRERNYAWTESSRMHRRFDAPVPNRGNASLVLGVLPALLLSLEIMRQRLTGFVEGDSLVFPEVGRFSRVAVNATSFLVTFLSGRLSDKPELALEQLRRVWSEVQQQRGPPALLTKAGEMRQLWSRPDVASFLLSTSAVVVHDDTGLLPSAYNISSWLVRTYGNFTRLMGAYDCLNIPRLSASRSASRIPLAERLQMEAEMRAAYRGPELPFTFGYGSSRCQSRGIAASNGVMLLAWESSLQTHSESCSYENSMYC
jgi:hypothetical protein